MTWNNVLIYATGGLAWGSIYAGMPAFNSTTTKAGWTAGAGAEYMFAPHWSAKVEYLFADLGTVNYLVAIPVNATERNLNIIRGGINYHF
jgi:outer membrane immunogenic protein